MEEALRSEVLLFNVESEQELHVLDRVAKRLGVTAPVALRVNPDLPPKTHAKTDTSVKGVKFGLDIDYVNEDQPLGTAIPGDPNRAVPNYVRGSLYSPHWDIPVLSIPGHGGGADWNHQSSP